MLPDNFFMSEKIDELSAAMVKAQEKMPKTEQNGKGNYGSYSTIEDILAKAPAHLAKHGLWVHQGLVPAEGGVGCVTTVLHSSGQYIGSRVNCLGAKPGPQGLGAVATYLRRYGWYGAIGLPDQDDEAQEVQDIADGKTTRKGATNRVASDETYSGQGSHFNTFKMVAQKHRLAEDKFWDLHKRVKGKIPLTSVEKVIKEACQ